MKQSSPGAPSSMLPHPRTPARGRARRPFLALLLGLALAGTAAAQEAGKKQEFRGTVPFWVMAGTTTTLDLWGENLAPKEIRFQQPGLTGKVVKTAPSMPKDDYQRRLGNTVATVEVTTAADLKPGLYRVTLTGEGVRPEEGKLLVDVPAPEIPEKEPNDTLAKPQVLPAGNVTVAGKLDNEGVDVFQINGKAGEKWRFEIFAHRLNAANKLEACLRLRDPRHAPVKAAVDQGQDCALEYQLPADGPYLLELFDGDNRSGGDFNYKLFVRKL